VSPYCITVCVPARLSAVRVTILHYSVCASKAVCSSCHHTALVCVPAMLSAVRVTILHYSVCASKAVCSSCHHTALQCVCQQCCLQFVSPYFITVCVCQQGYLQFVSPYCITVCVPAMLSAVLVTILHYSVCASKAVCSSCHHTALQCVCQQGCLQFVSPYCITVCVCQQCCLQFVSPYYITTCVPVRLSAVRVTILHYSVCASKAVGSSCHHTALQCVCQQGCLQFVSPYCITVCVPARLSAVRVTILHYSVCASNAVCSSCHHTTLQCVCQQGCLQFVSPYCITVCVPARLSAVRVTILHYSVCASNAVCSSCYIV